LATSVHLTCQPAYRITATPDAICIPVLKVLSLCLAEEAFAGPSARSPRLQEPEMDGPSNPESVLNGVKSERERNRRSPPIRVPREPRLSYLNSEQTECKVVRRYHAAAEHRLRIDTGRFFGSKWE